MNLANIPYPNVVENLKYEDILSSNKTLFNNFLNEDEIALLESDRYLALLECLAYRELLLRARINDSVKSMLLPYATKSDLDNVVAIYGIERLQGEYPSASIEFSLSLISDSDTTIPKGTILSSQDGEIARLSENVTIKARESKALGVAKLQIFTKTSEIKTEFIQTPFPFVAKAKQLSIFSGGAQIESDERLRQRAVLSLERFSTAGAAKAYIYHALSANAKVTEVVALNGGAGIVRIVIKSTDLSEETRLSVEKYLDAKQRRPLTDNVIVKNAKKVDVIIEAELELTDMFLSEHISKTIKSTKNSLGLGEDLNLSYIYSVLHQAGVYRANLKNPLNDVKVDVDSFISITYKLSFVEATL